MKRPRLRAAAGVVVLALALAPTLVSAGGAADRLDRFRELAASRLSVAQAGEANAETFREVYALLDEEIVESLASGGVFASTEFLQERLDGFNDAWGAAFLEVVRLRRLVVGAFQLGDAASGNSVRVYGRRGDGATLLATFEREGRPRVFTLPGGGEQFMVAWEGPSTGRGTRPLRLDVVREAGDDVRVVWSSAEIFPDGLVARNYTVRPGEVRVRYELRYPGWTPGCEGQTEQEDVYRLTSAAGGFVRVSRRDLDPWHRELRLSVARFFSALAAGDRAALATLVPDAALRDRLPSTLAAEPACDATDERAGAVSVAAVADPQRPWTLRWQRAAGGWRLTGATPVLP
ncbi:MAG TPA: hypothetical protein VGL09_04595 [Methylomirabilota bacterium]